jgi:hypothetical protein
VRIRRRIRIAWLLLRIRILYGWRRSTLSERVPLEVEPDHRSELEPIDTGGAYRATYRSQFGDASESHSSPHSEGSNCTMAAAAMALDHHTGGGIRRKPGEMRHAQSDDDGGTDLNDAAEAWARNGASLSIRSGSGWPKVVDALEEGRGVILQGTGGLAGCGDYTGGHAIYVAPEASGSRWLKGDPECSGWEWQEASSLRAFAERLASGVNFAVSSPSSSGGGGGGGGGGGAPAPVIPTPVPDIGPELRRAEELATSLALDSEVGSWIRWIGSGQPIAAARWDGSTWSPSSRSSTSLVDCADLPSLWGRGPVPDPIAAAEHARLTAATWDELAWRELVWR